MFMRDLLAYDHIVRRIALGTVDGSQSTTAESQSEICLAQWVVPSRRRDSNNTQDMRAKLDLTT